MFTRGLMRAAEMQGAELRHGTVVDLARRSNGGVRGVSLAGGEIVEGDAVVIAMGPWSILAARWLPLPAVLGYRGPAHGVRNRRECSRRGIVLEYREASGEILTPELFPRADGTTYVCAISSTGPVPVDPATLPPTRAPTRGSKPCVGIFRRRLPRRRSKHGRRASDRSPKMGFHSSVRFRVLMVPMWPLATVSGACSTRPQPEKR